jgi:molecular chaperone DnaK (HSP70)
MTRDQLEALTTDIAERTLAPCRLVRLKMRTTPEGINEVVGGRSTRMPLVQPCAGAVRQQPHCQLNPDEVGRSSGRPADILTGGTTGHVAVDVTLSLGIETMGGVMSSLIRRNTTIPASAKEMSRPTSTVRRVSIFTSCRRANW